MAFPSPGSFDYFSSGRPLVTLAKTTGGFDYFSGGRPLVTLANTTGVFQGGVNANGNALALVAGLVGVIGAAVIFGGAAKAAEIQSAPLRPTTFVAAPQVNANQIAPIIFGAPYRAQPGLQTPHNQRATQRAEFSAGRASVFGINPALVVQAQQPGATVVGATQPEPKRLQPQLVGAALPAYLAAPPLGPALVVGAQASGEQPPARIFGTLPVVAPALRSAIVVRANQAQDPGQPVVFGQAVPELIQAPPLRSAIVEFGARYIEQPAARIFGQAPSAVVLVLHSALVVAGQTPPQLAPSVFGAPLRAGISQRPIWFFAAEQRAQAIAPRIFGPLSLPPAPLRSTLVINAPQAQEQPAARIFGTLPLPPVPLRPAIVTLASHYSEQPAARIFGKPPPPPPAPSVLCISDIAPSVILEDAMLGTITMTDAPSATITLSDSQLEC